jgi:transcriptional regulator with XRE-family HTH domain
MSTQKHSTAPINDAQAIGLRIRSMRAELGLSLTELAEKARVSKSYLSTVENGTGSRPGAAVLHRLAEALGVTLADVLGRDVQATSAINVPKSLQEFARQQGLPETDVEMLAGIKFRGETPRDAASWSFIYRAIVMSVQNEGRADSR